MYKKSAPGEDVGGQIINNHAGGQEYFIFTRVLKEAEQNICTLTQVSF
jgi:hypothetical protein